MNMPAKKSAVSAVLLVLAVTAGMVRAQDQAPQTRIDRLRMQIERLTRRADGQVGVAIKHLESGQTLNVNGDMLFPMASAFKVPVLVELLYQVKEGRFKLEDEISVQKSEQHIGSGMISSLVMPGIKLSVLNMAHFMMMISDNSAADILLEKVGAENVNARLKNLGITGMSVNRSCQKLITDFQALRSGARTPEQRKAAIVKFGENPEDEATPVAMNTLLEKIYKKEIPDPDLSSLALQIMLKCETGEKRIKGELPPGTVVAHKTGTLAGTVDDCGIIYLPDGQGHVALTVLTKDFTADTSDVEEIIAKIARFVYDYFYFAN
ncbi:MAG: class A beta-lactamase-related serine hydrolase [Acidobacteriia bacterium]|nr:class A beta-lactamase-related serine hydrolase [Terriglobia bacterium]